MNASGTTTRMVRGGLWIAGLRIVSRLVGLANIMILARLLTPKDFGLFSIVALALSILTAFSETGMNTALVHEKDDIRNYLDTAWTIQAARGVILCVILISASPLITWFFDKPESAPLIYVMGLSPLLRGFQNIGVVFFQKELQFKKQFFLQSFPCLISAVIGIGAAFILRNAWALVIFSVTNSGLETVGSYFLHSYRPRLDFEVSEARHLFNFGKWMLVTKMVKYLLLRGDSIFVGRMAGITILGYYQLAMKISQLPADQIGAGLAWITFPAYSKLQRDIPRLRNAWLRTIEMATIIAFPICAGILILAPEIVHTILGKQWLPSIPVLRVLSVLALLKIIGNFGSIFQALGKPKIIAQISLLRLVALVTLIYPFYVGLQATGVALAAVTATLITQPIALARTLSLLKCSLASFFRAIIAGIFASVLMIYILFVIKNWISATSPAMLCVLLVAGASSYICGLLLLDLITGNRKTITLASEIIASFRSQ